MMVDGFSPKDIAKTLYVSYATIITHVQKIYNKLQVNSFPEALTKLDQVSEGPRK